MNEQKETVDSEVENNEAPTNWNAWYWGLALFLVVQIILFIYISNWFE